MASPCTIRLLVISDFIASFFDVLVSLLLFVDTPVSTASAVVISLSIIVFVCSLLHRFGFVVAMSRPQYRSKVFAALASYLRLRVADASGALEATTGAADTCVATGSSAVMLRLPTAAAGATRLCHNAALNPSVVNIH